MLISHGLFTLFSQLGLSIIIDFATMNGLFTIYGLNPRLGPVYIVYVPCSLLSMGGV
jgi:hypothetical protein